MGLGDETSETRQTVFSEKLSEPHDMRRKGGGVKGGMGGRERMLCVVSCVVTSHPCPCSAVSKGVTRK
jgi:hypothetical protein